MGTMFWNSYENKKGMSKELCWKLIIINITDMMTENDLQELLVNEKRPGPNYYDDCIKFNWVTALKDNHKKYMDNLGDKEFYTVKLSAEEEAYLKKMNA